MKHKILVFGKGFIGSKIRQELNADISLKTIRSYNDADREIKRYKPSLIINCIGETGTRNVDDCENDKNRTLFANSFIPFILAEVSLRNKIKFIHISSGCIYHFNYEKNTPLLEPRVPDFFDLFYSRTKIYAERGIEPLCTNFNMLIMRIRIPLDVKPHPRNLLTKLLHFKKVIDIPNSITYIPDFLRALQHLILIDARGVFNVVNSGSLRYPNLLDVYKKYVPRFTYQIIPYKKLNKTRTNVLLSTKKLEKTGFKIRNINLVLEECVQQYLNY